MFPSTINSKLRALDEAETRDGKLGTKTLDAIGNWFNNTEYGKRFQAGQERNAALDQAIIDQGGIGAFYTKLKNKPNELEQKILKGISDVTNIDERITTPATHLAIGAAVGQVGKLKPSHFGITTKIEKIKTLPPPPAPKQLINITNQSKSFDIAKNIVKGTKTKGIIPKYSSGAVVQTKDGPLYRPEPGTMQSSFMTTTGGSGDIGIAKSIIKGEPIPNTAIRDPLLRRANVPASEVNLGQSVKQTGIGLFDRNEAEGIRELVLQRAVERMDAPNQFIKNTLQPLYPNQDVTSLSTREVNKLIKEEGLWKDYKSLQRETKALKRSKADWSQTDIEDLHELGVFQELKNKNFSQIEPENIESWLKVQEGRVSASKGLDARHHMYLSSSKEILDPKTVSEKWRKTFLVLAKDKYDKFGSGSVISQDIGGHKAFDTTDDPGRPWNVKGRLNETLKKYTDLPRGKSGNIISPKVARDPKTDAPIFDLSTQEGKLQKILFEMKQKTSHGNWSNLETGFTVDGRLANYRPEVALSVAEHIYDIERVIGEQGLIVTKQLELWQNRIDTGKLGTPPDMDKALIELQKRIDNIEIPDIEGMKKMYEQDLNTLLTKGEEALRRQQATR